MKAVLYHGRGNITYDANYPQPDDPKDTQVKIKIDFCGICGSDLHEFLDGPIFFSELSVKSSPCMGHEICGEVLKVGANVSDFKLGDKVVVDACGTCLVKKHLQPIDKQSICEACQQGRYNCCDSLGFIGLGFGNGGLSEMVLLEERHLIKYNPDVIPVEIAALCEPLSVAWHAATQSGVEVHHSTLILGGGPIGLATIFALKGKNVKSIVISEPAKARRELAEKFGIRTFDPCAFNDPQECNKALKQLSLDGKGFDKTYDCSGIPATFNTSVEVLRAGGVATNVAIWGHKPIDFYPMNVTLHEKYITGSMCYTKRDFESVIKAFEAGLIDPNEVKELVTSVIDLSNCIEKGFQELIQHKNKHIKILVRP
jgi:(R,R)-butanediol dehydrogenase/meso-butanediol dehydrogenase/diacetyl reductase